MNTTRNEGITELRERAPTPGVVNMDRFEADLGRVPCDVQALATADHRRCNQTLGVG